MIEIWKPVPYKPFDEKYLISNRGRVRAVRKSKYSNNKRRFLRPGVGARGYGHVSLYHSGLHKQAFVHRMVAYAFIGTPPEGKNLVCHLDDNKLNNVADNLVWGNNTDNMRHMVEHKRQTKGADVNTAKLSEVQVLTIRKLYKEGSYSQVELAATFGMHQTQISRITRGDHWKHLVDSST